MNFCKLQFIVGIKVIIIFKTRIINKYYKKNKVSSVGLLAISFVVMVTGLGNKSANLKVK